MNSTTQKAAKPDSTSARKPGRPRNEAVTKLQKTLGTTRRRASQLLKQAELSDPGAGRDYLKLRCERMAQMIEKAELELARLRRNDEESVPVSELRAGIRCFLNAARVAIGQQGERLCMDIGESWPTHARRFRRFGNGCYFGAVGQMLYLGENRLVAAAKAVLEDGDDCYQRGPEAADTAQHNALISALAVIATHAEGPAGTPEQLAAVKNLAGAFGFPIPEEEK